MTGVQTCALPISVHSFADPGMITYSFLLGYLAIITLVGLGGVYYRRKDFKLNYNEDESLFSRENGLLFGAALIIGSALIIIVGTSAPIFGRGVEIKFYNQMNFPIAIIMTALIGTSLFLGWKSTALKDFVKHIAINLSISIAVTALVVFISPIDSFLNTLFVFSAIFTIVVNLGLFIKMLKTSYLLTGGHLAHIGVGVFLIGVLISGNYSQSQQIDLPKGEVVNALNHKLKFIGYNQIDKGGKFAFNVKVSDGNGFNIASPVMFNSDYNNNIMHEPDIIEGITKDFYISPLGFTDGKNPEDTTQIEVVVNKGKSFNFKGTEITFNKFTISEKERKAMLDGETFQMGADLSVKYKGKTYKANPSIIFKKEKKELIEAIIKEANIKIVLTKIDATGKVNLTVSDITANSIPVKVSKEMLTIEASIKPNINLVWLGVLFMTVGFLIAVIRRSKEYNIKGIFFVSTEILFTGFQKIRADYIRLLQDIALRGHTIGSHGHFHYDYRKVPRRVVTNEISNAYAILRDIIGVEATLWRSPKFSIPVENHIYSFPKNHTSLLRHMWYGQPMRKIFYLHPFDIVKPKTKPPNLFCKLWYSQPERAYETFKNLVSKSS